MYFLSVFPISVSTARHARLRLPAWRNVNVTIINNTQYKPKRTRITNINPCSAEIASVAHPPPPPQFFFPLFRGKAGGWGGGGEFFSQQKKPPRDNIFSPRTSVFFFFFLQNEDLFRN